MVGGEIFYALLKAIPSTSKLIMLGDPGQLEAVGSLNIATDMINSSIIPTVHLTQVHRQAKKSGILTTSYDVRNNIQLFNASFEGVDVRGELEDMILDIGQDRSEELDKFVKYFEDYYTGDIVDYNIMDIQVISPVKDRGETCVSELNNIVQSIVNPVDLSDESVYRLKFTKKKGTEEKTYYIQPGDKIMCTKNNYKLEDMMGNVVPVFNGWTGMVSDIDEENIYIKFPFYRFDVVFPQKTTRDSIMLGYVSTIHRLQGSEAKVIIGIVDYSTPPSMLTCQLVYTLITRAKKKCILIAENGALRKAIATDYVSTKRTFLPEFLEDSSIF